MTDRGLSIDSEYLEELVNSIQSTASVKGLTHGFYRYPARFSPLFARAAINAFTKPGDVVLDPFMGGGTTLVEARTLGRRAIGMDISSLATFVARAKTTVMSGSDLTVLQKWGANLYRKLNVHRKCIRRRDWLESGYLINISGKRAWPIRKLIELSIESLSTLQNDRQRRFARCLILSAAQWALDCRREIPTTEQFRERLRLNLAKMIIGAREYSKFTRKADLLSRNNGKYRTRCLQRSAIGLENEPRVESSPKLILTSPPYPGVHVLYHRWQVCGRKETPAPYWIANCLDGTGSSQYTFGDRKQKGLSGYFEQLYGAFCSMAKVANSKTVVVQMVGFAEPSRQFDRYLETLWEAGFEEIDFPTLIGHPKGRLWRDVPGRKWYASQRDELSSSKEVVLFHRRA